MTSTLVPTTTPALAPPAGVELVHYSPTIGTELHGVDLRDITPEIKDFLHELLLSRKVLFFRDQDLTPEQHLSFGRAFGELEIVPFLPHDDTYPEMMKLRRGSGGQKSYENIWHSDVSWRENPSASSILRSHVVPPVGGDTLWCDMVAAYDALSPAMKDMIEGLQAVHSIDTSLGVYIDQATMMEMLKKFPPQIHPVVRTHPETGEKLLYVNLAHTKRIKGLSPKDSRQLLESLAAHANTPEYQCRFRWAPNSVAWWDNRSTQHYAVADYEPAPRHMDRVTICGDKPF